MDTPHQQWHKHAHSKCKCPTMKCINARNASVIATWKIYTPHTNSSTFINVTCTAEISHLSKLAHFSLTVLSVCCDSSQYCDDSKMSTSTHLFCSPCHSLWYQIHTCLSERTHIHYVALNCHSQYCIEQSITILHWTVVHNTVLHSRPQYCIEQLITILYWTVIHNSVPICHSKYCTEQS